MAPSPDKKILHRKCQMASYNLLVHLDREIDPFIIVSEIMKTDKCDDFYSMAGLRQETVEEINKDDPQRLGRILSDKYANEHDRDLDQRVANKTTVVNNSWYVGELQRSLTWRNYMIYKLSRDGVERDMFVGTSLALLTSGAAVILGYQWQKIPIIYGMAFPFRDKIRAWFKKTK